jgi:MoxR-like ATPase
MTATALVTVLRAAGRAGVAVCLWGDPGVGKSALIQAAAAADDVPCEIVIGSLREPSDFAGLPVVSEEGVRMEPPAWAKRLHEAKAGYLFLDELSTSPPAVQAAMLGVALERRVGDLFLPRAVQVVAAANPPERAADGWDLSPPLATRFLHVAYTPQLTRRMASRWRDRGIERLKVLAGWAGFAGNEVPQAPPSSPVTLTLVNHQPLLPVMCA